VYNKKENFNEYIKQFETLLEKLNNSEKAITEKIDNANRKYSEYGIKGLHQDIERTHIISTLEKDLNEIINTKQEVINNILNLRAQQENITLKMDKILFDNSIMINEISKNFTKLSEIL
jgi:flagellar biosynthesis chaperone FliJ